VSTRSRLLMPLARPPRSRGTLPRGPAGRGVPLPSSAPRYKVLALDAEFGLDEEFLHSRHRKGKGLFLSPGGMPWLL
jgi:hypothetical protein